MTIDEMMKEMQEVLDSAKKALDALSAEKADLDERHLNAQAQYSKAKDKLELASKLTIAIAAQYEETRREEAETNSTAMGLYYNSIRGDEEHGDNFRECAKSLTFSVKGLEEPEEEPEEPNPAPVAA